MFIYSYVELNGQHQFALQQRHGQLAHIRNPSPQQHEDLLPPHIGYLPQQPPVAPPPQHQFRTPIPRQNGLQISQSPEMLNSYVQLKPDESIWTVLQLEDEFKQVSISSHFAPLEAVKYYCEIIILETQYYKGTKSNCNDKEYFEYRIGNLKFTLCLTESSHKKSGLELKAMNMIYSMNRNDLQIPRMAIVDYRGYRILISSLIPELDLKLRLGRLLLPKLLKDDQNYVHNQINELISDLKRSYMLYRIISESPENLIYVLHEKSINLRYLGVIRQRIFMSLSVVQENRVSSDQLIYLCRLLLQEMIARTIKCESRSKLRNNINIEDDMKREICKYLNYISLLHTDNIKFWEKELLKLLQEKYDIEIPFTINLHKSVNRKQLLLRVMELCHWEVDGEALEKCIKKLGKDKFYVFVPQDIIQIHAHMRVMTRVEFENGRKEDNVKEQKISSKRVIDYIRSICSKLYKALRDNHEDNEVRFAFIKAKLDFAKLTGDLLSIQCMFKYYSLFIC